MESIESFLSVSLIEPVVSHDEPGGADHSTNDRDVFFEQTLSFLQDGILDTFTLSNSFYKKSKGTPK